ncbi:hypothetical protein BMS3Abin02_01419 [bacterium BMS3Abin02]|nr:hypothetical protein BMS3Abin02_01419 [bacterium BMS3Abin02]HDL49833.1 hypothetical protein [Actinomycetota bacterium]
MRRLLVVMFVMTWVADACSPATQPPTSTVQPVSTVTSMVATTTTASMVPLATTTFVQPDVGPLAGLSWPGGRVPVGALLHDDGTTLWSITLDGERTALWEHPQVKPEALAAGPDGARVAMTVLLPAQSTDDWSSVLYVLEEDGTVGTVDAVDRFLTLESPMFIRPPTEPDEPVLLYWLRFGETVSTATGRMDTHVIVETDTGPAEVTVPLRHHEEVFAFHSYPGAAVFTITLSRQGDSPTRLEILKNRDYWRTAKDASPLLWSDNEFRSNTDIFDGVAWPTPDLYVIPVAQRFFLNDYSLRLLKDGCEYYGSHVVYQGTDIGRGYAEYPWPLLPGGPGQVLVVSAKDEQALLDGRATDVPWTAVDIDSGKLTPTGARYELGTWTWVAPRDDTNPTTQPPDCTAWTWSWP